MTKLQKLADSCWLHFKVKVKVSICRIVEIAFKVVFETDPDFTAAVTAIMRESPE